jgi:D-xylose transport system ATP-binding protein
VSKLVKRFGGVTALEGVDFDLRAGEVHCLCGENGAGKSTLIKILSGVHPLGSFDGAVLLDGRATRFQSPRDAIRAGISVIHQELAIVPELSVAENLFLGDLPRRGFFTDWTRLARESTELLERYGVSTSPETRAGALGVGRKQQIEILRAIRRRSRLLILDEPTSALGEAEARSLLALVRQLAKEGAGCVYITHRLDEVRTIADRVTVLRDGRNVATFETGAVPPGDLIRAMVGRPVSQSAPRRLAPSGGLGPPLLEVESLCVAPDRRQGLRLLDISLEVRAGEVLGLAGLMGSGRSELLLHLFGAWGARWGGSVRLCGEPYDDPSPARSTARGLALLSEDRCRSGVIPDQSVRFNLTLSALRRVARHGWVDPAAESRHFRQLAGLLKVRCPDPEAAIDALSGGNQQKVLLGRVLLAEPRVILLDEPTRGVDVATKFEIYEVINRLTDEGKALLLVTSELPELLGMCDRVLVLRQGRIAADLPRARFSQERVLAAALGHEEVDTQQASTTEATDQQ